MKPTARRAKGDQSQINRSFPVTFGWDHCPAELGSRTISLVTGTITRNNIHLTTHIVQLCASWDFLCGMMLHVTLLKGASILLARCLQIFGTVMQVVGQNSVTSVTSQHSTGARRQYLVSYCIFLDTVGVSYLYSAKHILLHIVSAAYLNSTRFILLGFPGIALFTA